MHAPLICSSVHNAGTMPRLKPPSKEDSLLLPPFTLLPDRRIFVPRSDEEFERARTAVLAQRSLGFDTESKPIFHPGQIDNGPHVVQLATLDAAWILQLHHPKALELAREVLAAAHICKVGFGLEHDTSALPKRLGVELLNVLDLDRVFKRHGYGNSTGVRAAVALVLRQNFHKSKKQSTSNWANHALSPAQIRYAANDAHAPAVIYAALPAWEAQQPPLSAPKKTQPQRSMAATSQASAPSEKIPSSS